MCRSITTLFHCDPPATEDEMRAAAVQFVRKVSGFTAPSQRNAAAFAAAVDAITIATSDLLQTLDTNAPVRKRVSHHRPRHTGIPTPDALPAPADAT